MALVSLYGFFSQLAFDTNSVHTLIYRHVDGREVEVNFVTSDPLSSGTSWPDIVSLGEVTKALRPGRPGMISNKMWGARAPSEAQLATSSTRKFP